MFFKLKKVVKPTELEELEETPPPVPGLTELEAELEEELEDLLSRNLAYASAASSWYCKGN